MSGAVREPAPPALAYLTSQYPMLSMIFVLREIVQLRRSGIRIETASISAPDRLPEAMTVEERDEAARTYCLKRHGIAGAIGSHLSALLRHPAGYLRGWALALRLARLDLRRLAYILAYFTEALMVGQWMASEVAAPSPRPPDVAAGDGGDVRQARLRRRPVHHRARPRRVLRRARAVPEREGRRGRLRLLHQRLRAQPADAARALRAMGQARRLQARRRSADLPARGEPQRRCGLSRPLRRPPDAGEGSASACRRGRASGAEGRDVHLHVVGAGVDRDSLERQVARLGAGAGSTFEGAVNQDRIRAFYAARMPSASRASPRASRSC